MRVGVVSGLGKQTGKTALSLLLANAYPSATGRESVYCTNSDFNEILGLMQFRQEEVALERSINVVTALSASSLVKDEILDYAYRPNNSHALLYDIFSRTVPIEEAVNNFIAVLDRLGSRFIIIDLRGDVQSFELKSIMDVCDVILYVVKPVKEEFDEYKEFVLGLTEEEKVKLKLVCNMWDSIKVKSVKDYTKLRMNNILWFPYHPNIQRTMFEGRLCILNRLMIEGRDNCLSLRQPLKDILSFISDTKSLKIIKEVTQWKV